MSRNSSPDIIPVRGKNSDSKALVQVPPPPRKFLFLEQPPDKKARFGQKETKTRIVPVVMNERDGLFT